jgi:hypothetical protein
VILDGTLLRIDRVGMAGGRDRPFYSGKPAGRLIWVSPALPDARHDMSATASTASSTRSTPPACPR